MTQNADIGVIPEWTLGWRLQRALAQSGLKTEEIAEILGVSRGTTSRWMNDRGAPPRKAFINAWAMATGIPVQWLLTGGTENNGTHPDGTGATDVTCK